jgi:hypothetical protein
MSRFEFGQTMRDVLQGLPRKGDSWRRLAIPFHPPGFDLGRSKIRKSTEILIVTRTLLENASLTMKEMVHFIAEAVEISDFLIGEIHLRSCSKFGVVRIASAFHGSGARPHLALDQ